MKVTKDLNQVLSLPLTACGVFSKVINVSSVNTSSTQSSASVNTKFMLCARHCLGAGDTTVNKTTTITWGSGDYNDGDSGESERNKIRINTIIDNSTHLSESFCV